MLHAAMTSTIGAASLKGERPRHVAAVRPIGCRGIQRDPEEHAGPLMAALLAAGQAWIAPLRLGTYVDGHCRVMRTERRPTWFRPSDRCRW
jgi:hypothetical protein